MDQELFTKQLEEIEGRIHKLEVKEIDEDDKNNSWFWGKAPITKKTILERKAVWEVVKRILKGKLS